MTGGQSSSWAPRSSGTVESGDPADVGESVVARSRNVVEAVAPDSGAVDGGDGEVELESPVTSEVEDAVGSEAGARVDPIVGSVDDDTGWDTGWGTGWDTGWSVLIAGPGTVDTMGEKVPM